MAARKLTDARTHGLPSTYGVGCRCPACTKAWVPWSVARQKEWRRRNPDKVRAQRRARKARILEERRDADGGN